jgi:cytochrome c5
MLDLARAAFRVLLLAALFLFASGVGAPAAPRTTRSDGGDGNSFHELPSILRGSPDFAAFFDALQRMSEGRRTFRFDTFGDEAFWGGTLRLHEALAQTTPRQALALGLKVDADALPARLASDLRRGRVNLDDPTVTAALLRQNAVVGVTGFFDASGALTSVGLQCALCHSTVDDALLPGVGRRLDGWANRDLDVGQAGVNLHTWTGWGSVPHWNALVANLEMGGQGVFVDHRLDDASRFPIAAREGFSDVRHSPDRVTPKLPGLHLYQLALRAPPPPKGSFDPTAASRGKSVFEGTGKCAVCHVAPIYTEPGHNLHAPADIGIDAFQSERSPARGYRTSPLAGLWTHGKGGYYHDGRFATLDAVIDHYDRTFGLGLSGGEKSDLVEYLKSL